MKKILLLTCVLMTYSFSQSIIFLGAENQKRVYIGYDYDQFLGFFVKNTVFKQDLDLQQVEINPYINYRPFPSISIRFNPYFGTRYNSDFYFAGSRFSLNWSKYHFFQFKTEAGPYYHSRNKYSTLYTTQIQTFLLPNLGLAVGVKNTPEYNLIEKRMFGGVVIKDTHSQIETTLSAPYSHKDSHLIRFNISFHHNIHL